MELMAKSPEQGNLTLLAHTRHVTACCVLMARQYGLNTRLARLGGILHDLGKAHPHFQKKVTQGLSAAENMTSLPQRHELSSLLFLPLFGREDWPALTEMVAAHHKSVRDDSRKLGLIDWVYEQEGLEQTFLVHAHGGGPQQVPWATWSARVAPLLKSFGIGYRPVSLEEALEAFSWAAAYCDELPAGWSKWRGLLMGADHFASEYQEQAPDLLKGFYKRPDLQAFERNSALHPLSLIRADKRQRHTFVIAPTGAGKTDFLLRRCRGRLIYTLPFQASINAMYRRLRDFLQTEGPQLHGERLDIRRVHAASRIELTGPDGSPVAEEQFLQRNPGASIKITTPHQLAPLVFGISGFEAAALDVMGCDVILDEVHVYDDVSRSMVLELIRRLVALRCRVHIGTATLPERLKAHILEALGGPRCVYQVQLPARTIRSFNRHIVAKLNDEAAARQQVLTLIQQGKKVLFIANQVATAQERYRWAQEHLPGVPVLLVHSRFRRKDRAGLEAGIQAFNDQAGACLVIATQVVEVSLDISFDTLVSDAAPLDNLIQRFGRVNRKRSPETLGRLQTVYVIAPGEVNSRQKDRIGPYLAEVVRKSFDILPEGPLEETRLQAMIDAVYDTIELASIDSHLAFGSIAPIGRLCHRPRSALLDILEIDAAVCIIESDAEAYLQQRGTKRMQLEIPVPWRTACGFLKTGRRLEVGSYPIVIPDACYDFSTDAVHRAGRGAGLLLQAADPPAKPAAATFSSRSL